MKNISLRTKILTGILTGGIYLSSASTTFALTTTPITISGNTLLTSECKQVNNKKIIEEPIITNTITKEQANKIKSVINKSITTNDSAMDYVKTISKQEDKSYNNSTKISYINPITTLVANGTITQNQADKILMKQLFLYHERMLKSSL